jgi:hypothetical protein
MAKWICVCGTTIRSSGDIPNPMQWMLLSDQDLDGFTGLVQAEDVYMRMTIAFRCPRCDRCTFSGEEWTMIQSSTPPSDSRSAACQCAPGVRGKLAAGSNARSAIRAK